MEVVEDVKRGAEELFNLSMEDKKKFWQREGDMEGFGEIISKPKDEPSDWVDGFYILTLPSHHRKPHLFPNLPLPFRSSLLYFSPFLITKFQLSYYGNTITILNLKTLQFVLVYLKNGKGRIFYYNN